MPLQPWGHKLALGKEECKTEDQVGTMDCLLVGQAQFYVTPQNPWNRIAAPVFQPAAMSALGKRSLGSVWAHSNSVNPDSWGILVFQILGIIWAAVWCASLVPMNAACMHKLSPFYPGDSIFHRGWVSLSGCTCVSAWSITTT